MSKALMNDILLQAVGSQVISKNGETVGKIIEVIKNTKSQYIEYMILKCKHFKNEKARYFAIPASTRFISITDTFTILFQFPIEDIFVSQKVRTEQCPAPNLKHGKSIYELTNYQTPETRPYRYWGF